MKIQSLKNKKLEKIQKLKSSDLIILVKIVVLIIFWSNKDEIYYLGKTKIKMNRKKSSLSIKVNI